MKTTREKMIKVELTSLDMAELKALRELCIDDDLLDLQAYDSISRGNKISDAWEALKVIERILLKAKK